MLHVSTCLLKKFDDDDDDDDDDDGSKLPRYDNRTYVPLAAL